jgi:uncharacterized protein (DUF1501 family)
MIQQAEGAAGCCNSFNRAQALRASAAAGGGSVRREWDPSMPRPAGSGVDRRAFLRAAGGGLLAVYGAERLGLTNRLLGDGIAEAASAQGASSPILVSLFLQGGLDALTLLAPSTDPTYQKLRPTLAVAPGSGTPLTEDPSLEWNPAATPLADLHAAGQLTVIPGIGYAGEDMSHFTSRHYWEVGATSTELMTGWMGRFLDAGGSRSNPLQGLSLDGQMNPALATAKNPVAAITTPQDFSLWIQGMWGNPFDYALDTAGEIGDVLRYSRDPAIAQVAEAASEVQIVRKALKPFQTSDGKAAYTSPVSYPTSGTSDLPQRFAGLAAMIAAGLPLKCVALTTDTAFDTHSDQPGTFTSGVQLVAQSLQAFQADLAARGIADRVLVQVWSEFGRRVQENGSDGTDHGAAGTGLLIGSRVAGGMLGEFPALTNLDANGNQKVNVDFRGLYCSLLEQWFDQDAAAVIPTAGKFQRYQLLSAAT